MSSHLIDELVADDPPKRLEIECAARRQGSRQIVVAGEGRADSIKGGVAKDVIRVLMRVDDIEDGFVGASADGGEQPLADRHAAAGVDDGHALVADHEADIGDVAKVLLAHQGDFAGMDEHAWRDFLDWQRGQRLAARRALRPEDERCDEGADEPAPGSESEVLRGLSYSVSFGSGFRCNSRPPRPEAPRSASKARPELVEGDALGGVNEATNWTILRDAMHGIAPQDEAVEFIFSIAAGEEGEQ